MKPNETQPQNPQDGIGLTSDELAAAMGFMTTLGDQQMQTQMQPEEQTEEGMPEETPEETAQPIEEMESRIMQELQTLREEMKAQGDGKSELAELKKQIETILNETE